VWDALALVAQTRTAHADALIAERRLQLTVETADLVQRLASISDARLRAGDISELEARSVRSDAARVQVMRRAVEHDGTIARLTLAAILGLATMADELRPIPGPLPDPSACGADGRDSRTHWRRVLMSALPRSVLRRRPSAHAGSERAC
jgi:outer membrane protein TolC